MDPGCRRFPFATASGISDRGARARAAARHDGEKVAAILPPIDQPSSKPSRSCSWSPRRFSNNGIVTQKSRVARRAIYLGGGNPSSGYGRQAFVGLELGACTHPAPPVPRSTPAATTDRVHFARRRTLQRVNDLLQPAGAPTHAWAMLAAGEALLFRMDRMAEGVIKRLTDKGFGFIALGGGKDLFFIAPPSKVSGSRISGRGSACRSPKAKARRDRGPRRSSRSDQACKVCGHPPFALDVALGGGARVGDVTTSNGPGPRVTRSRFFGGQGIPRPT